MERIALCFFFHRGLGQVIVVVPGYKRGLPERKGKEMEIWEIEGDRVVEDDGDGEGVRG